MATEGFVGEIIDVLVRMDHEIFEDHTVVLTSPTLQLYDTGVPVPSMNMIFTDANWETDQTVGVMGSTAGVHDLKAVITSPYYQSGGVLKEKNDSIPIYLSDEEAEGFSGQIPGAVAIYNAYTSGTDIEGTFKLKIDNAVIGRVVQINRTIAEGHYSYFRIKITKPGGGIDRREGVSDQVNYTMTLAGTYRFDFFDQVVVRDKSAGGVLPSTSWVASYDYGATAAFSGSSQYNTIFVDAQIHDPHGYGILNTFSEVYDADEGSTLCGTPTCGFIENLNLYFNGTSSGISPTSFSISGYYVASGATGVQCTNVSIGGVIVVSDYTLRVFGY